MEPLTLNLTEQRGDSVLDCFISNSTKVFLCYDPTSNFFSQDDTYYNPLVGEPTRTKNDK